jgi:hypothetical protein
MIVQYKIIAYSIDAKRKRHPGKPLYCLSIILLEITNQQRGQRYYQQLHYYEDLCLRQMCASEV